jgi:CheY-like chemotaxis protein
MSENWESMAEASERNRELARRTLVSAQAGKSDILSPQFLTRMIETAEAAAKSADDLYRRVLTQLEELRSRHGGADVKHSEQAGDSAPQIRNSTGTRELILIIDDDREVAESVADILAEEGFRLLIAETGAEGVRTFDQLGGVIDLVILDFLLPDGPGDGVLNRLKRIDPNVNVLLGSGFLTEGVAGRETLERMRLAGLRGFIPKPYTRSGLLEHVSKCLDCAATRSVAS